MSTVTTTSPAIAAQTVRGRLVAVLASLGRHINNLVAAFIAEHERRAAIETLQHLNDRELRDIGLTRADIHGALAEKTRERIRRWS